MEGTYQNTMLIGIKSMDSEHKILFKQADQLNEAIRTEQYKEEVFETMQVLLDYTVHHFNSEEGLLKRCNYPELKAHKQMHDGLVQTLKEIIDELDNDEFFLHTARKFNRILTNWVIQHIGEEDKKYAAYINSRSEINEF